MGADEKEIKKAFSKIKNELTDHLEAINGNTQEINSNYSYMQELEKMITKLGERIDAIELKIETISGKEKKHMNYKHIKLSAREQEVFLMLYEEKGELLDYVKIARSLGLTGEIVRKIVAGIINKGIPIIKKEFDSKIYLMLDADFRNRQAKENLIKLQ
jgi:DNA-binding CsgD family transcriptional regulator